MPGVYRIEVSPNRRAGCSRPDCKKAAIKIGIGELRFASLITIREHQSWVYKHWGCVTPVQIANINEVIEHDTENFDGFAEIEDEHVKEKIKRAIHDGHVDDEDWRGDVEYNRPGKKGYHAPVPRKKVKAETECPAEEASEGAPEPASRKRSRPQKDIDADVKDEGPAVKKAKKNSKSNAEQESGVEPPVKKGKGGKKIKAEHESDADLVPKSAPRRKNKKESLQASDEEDSVAVKAEMSDTEGQPKRKRAPRKAAPKKIKTEHDDADSTHETKDSAAAENEESKPKKGQKVAPETTKQDDTSHKQRKAKLKATPQEKATANAGSRRSKRNSSRQ